MHIICTNAFLVQEGFVLLGWKQRGVVTGLLNGFGGRVDFGEDTAAAARREFTQETGGAEVLDLTPKGVVTFTCEEGSTDSIAMHIFRATRLFGTPRDTPEMRGIRWRRINESLFSELPPGDQLWLPTVLEGGSVEGHIHSAEPGGRVIRHRLKLVEAVRV
ncbi:MAG: hypothetical protein A3B37_02490 [Candidatus Sungbacteria bacterium RIFCSPLOWO2_01_FULL_59_16]|uniref:Oxidized purine nucleoside triphosphate hydrolase n=1 Tax=Candidatus Sungbacteria bacterium RIFCSPLOWO2_01_FULL_59_16 TaxID=1802280 RepID=A0A1G2LCP4_9BACT|nr:MAG: hypothetical protein A3B37_02490 [Candidatus Sungbacteria bacterium RIFCSPLOWO2_01_FULL_59_16]